MLRFDSSSGLVNEDVVIEKDKTDTKLINALMYAKRPLDMKEWSIMAAVSVPTVSKRWKNLVREGEVLVLPPRGSSRRRKFLAAYDTTDVPILPKIPTVYTPDSIDKTELLQLLVAWSKQPWTPKAFKSARGLPVGIAQLFGYAVEASFGAKVTQEDLNTVRVSFSEFLDDVQNLWKVVDSVLATKELWNEKKFVEFLLEGRDPGQIQEFVHRVRELN